MGSTWVRTMNHASLYDSGWFLLAQVPSGSTVRRIRWEWGFSGFTEVTTDLHATAAAIQLAGINTVIGNGSETPPLPFSNPSDVAPPTQRWLWWEARQPVALAVDAAGGTVSWRDSGAQEIPDIKVNVLATGIPGGDNLDVWFAWQAQDGAWDTSGSVELWVAASVLYTTP